MKLLGLPCLKCGLYHDRQLQFCPFCGTEINSQGKEEKKMSIESSFKTAVQKMISVASTVKSEIIKAASAVDSALVKVQADAPEVDAVVNAFVPGASKFVDLGLSALEAVAKVLDAGGTAAEQNLTNAGFDSALVADVKALIPEIKSLASGQQPASTATTAG